MNTKCYQRSHSLGPDGNQMGKEKGKERKRESAKQERKGIRG